MRTNKFSIGGLIGIHLSSSVFMVIRAISSQFIYLFTFYENILNAQKSKSNQNQQTK